MHTEEDLALLWNLVENQACTTWGEHIGLRSVPFSLDTQEFLRTYRGENRRYFSTEAGVVWSVTNVLNRLEGMLIHHHHLTCAAENDIGGDNSALCIHYCDPEISETRRAVALPGVNYIPDEKTKYDLEEIEEGIC